MCNARAVDSGDEALQAASSSWVSGRATSIAPSPRCTPNRSASSTSLVATRARLPADATPPGGRLGSLPYVSEFSRSGSLLFNLQFPTGVNTYRAYRFRWKG